MTTSQMSQTMYLDRSEGRVAYDVRGEGPLVVCLPGMGDVRFTYRVLADRLAAAGYRVATMDLRGHGDSDTTFTRYDDVAAGEDALALVAHLSDHAAAPAVLVGNSMGAGAAVWAAAERPELVGGLALLGAFVRNPPVSAVQKVLLALALQRPWGRASWLAYWKRSFPTVQPADLAEHRAKIVAALRRPGSWAAFKATTRTTHEPARARLGDVHVPALVVMGTKDPDFNDPAAEGRFVAGALGGDLLLVEGAGHYPHAEMPDEVVPAVLHLLGRVAARA
jgi:pimeloyl-ACP methyl ester carboxylesterase